MRISNKKTRRTPLIVASVVLLLFITAGLFYLYRSNTLNEADENLTSTQESGGGITSGKENTKGASNQPAPTPDSNVMPATPTGTFVSNHRPNLSGSPAPNTIASTCTTTPGSECTIEFTKGDITKTLPKKVADVNGNTSWDWKLQDIGLVVGEWQVTAVASNGDNRVKASDSMPLLVGE